jgi:hypothetical protein
MKSFIKSTLCLVMFLLVAPALFAQDTLKYHSFSLGMTLSEILTETDQKPADVRILHQSPVLLQDLRWWPLSLSARHQSNSVEQILFSFYNGELYKMFVTYDSLAVKGLRDADVIQSLSAKYGTPVKVVSEQSIQALDRSEEKQVIIATWENSLCTFNLVHLTYSQGFGLVIFSKVRNPQAETAEAQSISLEEQQRPEKEADQLKKDGDELEAARQKNIRTFQP